MKTLSHDHDQESLNPSPGHGGAALMDAAPAVSISDGHGQGLGSWQSSVHFHAGRLGQGEPGGAHPSPGLTTAQLLSTGGLPWS